MKYKCFRCKHPLTEVADGKFFTTFNCYHCGTHFCLAKDNVGTWSFLDGKGSQQWYTQCDIEMDEANKDCEEKERLIPEKVVFT